MIFKQYPKENHDKQAKVTHKSFLIKTGWWGINNKK